MQNVSSNFLSPQTSFLFCNRKLTTMANTIAMTGTPLQSRPLLCNNSQLVPPKPSVSLSQLLPLKPSFSLSQIPKSPKCLPRQFLTTTTTTTTCFATRNSSSNSKNNSELLAKQDESFQRKLTQAVLWVMEAVYIFWLFLLPFAPGDPVWAISTDTINSLVGLSLNFFFILPISNFVGIHALEPPVLHPMSEGLFNFVVGWTFMFAPLLYTDFKNDRYKGSLDALWGLQMFLTNTFLIPYMAIRLNETDASDFSRKPSLLGSVMIKGAPIVGLVGGAVCAISLLWALFGRTDGNFGNVNDRWNFLLEYLGSERLAYAFIWDIVLYTIFQPWLIGENLANVAENRVKLVNYIRYIPVIGLAAYLFFLKRESCRVA